MEMKAGSCVSATDSKHRRCGAIKPGVQQQRNSGYAIPETTEALKWAADVDGQTGAIEPPLVQRFRHPLTGVWEFGQLQPGASLRCSPGFNPPLPPALWAANRYRASSLWVKRNMPARAYRQDACATILPGNE
jgi:hypothetical protein